MKNIGFKFMATAMVAATASCTVTDKVNDEALIGRQEINVENRLMTPEALWAMGRIGEFSVSPDNSKIVYTVSYYSVKENRSNTELFIMNADGTDNRQITKDNYYEGNVAWIAGGKKIAFLSNRDGNNAVWTMNPDGSGMKKISDFDGDIDGFKFSPDEKNILFVSQIKYGESVKDIYPDLDKSSGRIVDDLMYKHWDEWVETIPHPFVAAFDGNSMGKPVDIMAGEPYESPMKPFGGMEQFAWSPDSKSIAYTSRKKTGKEYAFSTDSDIYIYDLESGKTRNICKEDAAGTGDRNLGYDTNPQFSSDGKQIAWLSMERDGYESDRNRLYVMNLADGSKKSVSENFESNVDAFCWSVDNAKMYFTGVWHGESHIYSIDLADGCKVDKLTEGMFDYSSVSTCGDKLIAGRHSLSMADELYAVDLATKEVKQLTFENKHIYDKLDFGEVKARWSKTTDNKQLLSWVVYPPQFDPDKKYPVLLFCQGGPQSPVSQFWSYRWNLQIMAANGYIVIAPNRRGLPGFGMEWLEAISGDYGGQCMKDYLSAIDEFCTEPYVDKDRLGCVGASFGGFSVYWLAGHHDGRFKAFIAHDGIFNIEQQYLETEEMWFADWDMGGAYWEKNNPIAQRTFANSPHKFVDKWDTPILCIHGEKDYRILASQGMSAFNAAKLRGIPAELLIFPDENHWVLKPQNGILWQRVFFRWLDKWLK